MGGPGSGRKKGSVNKRTSHTNSNEAKKVYKQILKLEKKPKNNINDEKIKSLQKRYDALMY